MAFICARCNTPNAGVKPVLRRALMPGDSMAQLDLLSALHYVEGALQPAPKIIEHQTPHYGHRSSTGRLDRKPDDS
jgi:hypothetical protein